MDGSASGKPGKTARGVFFTFALYNKKGLQKDRPASAEEEIRTHPNGPQVMYCY